MCRVLAALTALMMVTSVGAHGQWSPASPLPAPRWYPGCCALNGFIYVTGGEQGSAMGDVWFAQVEEDGLLTPWVSTAALPTATGAIGCVVHDGYIYVIGGYNGSSDFTTVWFAPILQDGSVGPWGTTTPMPAVRRCHGACAHNGYLYITGGFTMQALPTPHSNVWFAEVQGDGSIATWVATTSLLEPQYGHPCSAYGERLFITGGQSAFNYFNTTSQGHIQGNGSVDPWSPWDNLPESRTGHGSCTCAGFLYVLGGTNSGGNMSSVRYTRVAPSAEVPTDSFAARHSGVWLEAGPTVTGNHIEIECRMAPAYGYGTLPVSLDLYDVAGRRLHSSVNVRLEHGNNRIPWTAPQSGVFLLRLSTPWTTATQRIVAVR